MEMLYRILSWIFGVMATLMGLMFLTLSIIGGLFFLLIGLLLLPPARDYVFEKYKISIQGTTRGFLIFVCLIISMSMITHDRSNSDEAKAKEQAKAQTEKIIQDRKDNLEYFAKNKTTILAQLNTLLTNQDYKGVVDGSRKYLITKDTDLQAIHNKANEKLLLVDLNNTKIEPGNLNKLQSIYQQLSFINPDFKDYKNSAEHYAKQAKIVEDKKKEEALKAQQEVERKKTLEAQFSPWDGSHRGVERHIKKVMNDPDSYKHDETRYIDNGDHLIIIASFRGKNAFGGVVRNTIRAKVDLQGNVLQIIE
jgi:hypothetical protein